MGILYPVPTERQRLVKKLDQVFSRYIRTRVADERGFSPCFTSGIVKHWTEMDAGHFMSRACMSTRWNVKNVQCQSKRDNAFRGGEQYKFGQELDKKYGEGTAQELYHLSKTTKKFGVHELREMIEVFKVECERINEEKGL